LRKCLGLAYNRIKKLRLRPQGRNNWPQLCGQLCQWGDHALCLRDRPTRQQGNANVSQPKAQSRLKRKMAYYRSKRALEATECLFARKSRFRTSGKQKLQNELTIFFKMRENGLKRGLHSSFRSY
jgi:hypothetical protein